MNVNACCRNCESLQMRGSLCWQVLWSRVTVWTSCTNSPRLTGGSCTSLRTSPTVCQGWRSTRTRWVACPAQYYWKPRNWGSVTNRLPSRWKGTCSLHGHDITRSWLLWNIAHIYFATVAWIKYCQSMINIKELTTILFKQSVKFHIPLRTQVW